MPKELCILMCVLVLICDNGENLTIRREKEKVLKTAKYHKCKSITEVMHLFFIAVVFEFHLILVVTE